MAESKKRKMVRRQLTASRIDQMKTIYTILADEFDENKTDELDFDHLFGVVMKKSKGSVNPFVVKRELELI